MANVLLDCGTHHGGGLNDMIRKNNIDSSWEIYTWEANPYAYKRFLQKKHKIGNYKISHFNQAVGDREGFITVNIQESGGGGHSGKGTSIMSLDEWRPTGKRPFVEAITVPMIDFSSWMLKNLTEEDYVVVKMDIEGAEYNVLERVIETQSVKFINKIFIEWHSHMFENPLDYKRRENDIIKILEKNNISCYKW